MVRKILLVCGIVASALYVVVDIVASKRWKGYSYTSQTISELFAVDAPTRPLYLRLLAPYGPLWTAFGIGIWLSAGRRHSLRVVAAGLIGKEVLGTVVGSHFPMHQREALAPGEGTSSDAMHAIITSVGVLSFLTAIWFGATTFGKRFRLYSIVTVLLLIAGGTLSFLQAPRMSRNQPTPGMGIEERICAYGYLLWSSVLAIKLLRGQCQP